MATSQNGWGASADAASIKIKPFEVAGVSFPGGVAYHDYCDVVLKHVIQNFHDRVEKLRKGWCWGYYFRANRNNPNSLSNHSSGTAVDVNAPLRPNGVARSKNFSPAQIAEIHKILAEVNGLGHGTIVRWGGDYTQTVDSMHFEIVGSRAATTAAGKDILAGKLAPRKVTPKVAQRNVLDVSNVAKAMTNATAIANGAVLKRAIAEEVGAGGMDLTTLYLGAEARKQYALVQRKFLASEGNTKPSPSDVDGIPGPSSLRWLAARHGLTVTD